jgi:hypothetical protein
MQHTWYNRDVTFTTLSDNKVDLMDRPYLTVDVERRGYGRRYTGLPVDTLSREGFSIDFTGAYMRPDLIDIHVGDVVRWREGERLVQAVVAQVRHEDATLHVGVEGVFPLPPDAFFP